MHFVKSYFFLKVHSEISDFLQNQNRCCTFNFLVIWSKYFKKNVFRIDDSPNVYLLKNDGFLTRSTYIVLIHEFDNSKPGVDHEKIKPL